MNKPSNITRSTHKSPIIVVFCVFAVFMLFVSIVLGIALNNPKTLNTSKIAKTSITKQAKTKGGSAKSGSVSISSVYTTDANRNRKTAFERGATVDYNVDLENTMSRASSVDLQYKVVATEYNQFVTADLYSFDSTRRIATLPPGPFTAYLPVSIPLNAAPATYAIQVTAESSVNAFRTSNDQSTFIVQPPSQLGPFNTGNFTRNGGNDRGHSQLTLFQSGAYNFVGCYYNSSFIDVSDNLVFGISSSSGVIYQFIHTGGITGTWRFWNPQHQDCWDTWGTSGAIAANWIPLTATGTMHWEGDVNTDLGPLLNGIWQFFTKVAGPVAWKIINVIWNEVSLALEDGAGGAVADGAVGVAVA